MTQLLNLTEKRHAFRSGGAMAAFLARPGASERAGIRNVVSSDPVGMAEIFGAAPASSGFAVTDRTATSVSTVFACLSKIAGAVLQLPVHQYRRSVGGDRERMEQSALWWLLNESPAPNWTAASWKEWIVRCVHLRGDQHTEIVRDRSVNGGGRVIGLKPLHPDWSCARNYRGADGDVRIAYDIYDPIVDEGYTLDQDDVLHFTGFGFDGCRSLSVIQHAARNAVGNALAASDYIGKNLGSGAMPKIALTYPNKLAPDQTRLLRESFVATYASGPTQQRLPLILTEGGTATALNISPADMQLLESRNLEAEHICEACGVPPIMIGRSEKTSSWGTGVEQITLGFVKFTLQPHLSRWEEELNRKLFRRAGQFVEFELDALLRGDSKAQAEAFRFAIGGPGSGDGWMSVDEVRKLKNLPAIGGEFAKPFTAQRGAASPATTGTTA